MPRVRALARVTNWVFAEGDVIKRKYGLQIVLLADLKFCCKPRATFGLSQAATRHL
jgi:hypothetical protein